MSDTIVQSTITLGEATLLLDNPDTSVDVLVAVKKVLKARAERDNGRSANRARAFLVSRGIPLSTRAKAAAQAQKANKVQTAAKPAKKARPSGPGSRGGCPVKRICSDHADAILASKGLVHDGNHGEWIAAYKDATAWFRALAAK
jgi:hypothetical protein